MPDNNRFSSMAAMMGKAPGAAPVPTQNFNASNILGTPVPQVGDNKGRPNYASAVGTNVNQLHIVFVAIGIAATGYLLYHFTFEK
jgi:hypothetical protein